MLAVHVRSAGGPEQLAVIELADPVPKSHEVLIEIHASALNRADLLQRRGLYPAPAGESEILGLECAGVVRAVGNEVSEYRPGARVMALLGGGGYAELVSVHERLVMPIPETLSFEHAAAIPEAFLTAYEALLNAANLAPGERVLIHAGASGVGSAAVQIARELGAFVYATAKGEHKLALLQSLGVERAIDYASEDFLEVIQRDTGGRGVDVIVDFIGASYAERNHAGLATGGRWVVVGLLGGARASVDLGRLLMRRQTLTGIVMRARPLPDKSAIVRAFRRELLPFFDDGRLRPIVDSVYPLTEARAAHERMEANANAGKIILAVR